MGIIFIKQSIWARHLHKTSSIKKIKNYWNYKYVFNINIIL